MNTSTRTQQIRLKGFELGFAYIGFARAEMMDPEARRLESWLNEGRHGEMDYMANYFDKRVDPTKLVPGAKTVISLMYNYYTDRSQQDDSAPKISKYAYGKDYHYVLKNKLKTLLKFIQEEIGDVHGRCFVDSAPVMERDWAKRSGIGWVGKNTLLINPKVGSYYFLAELIIDLSCDYDHPIKDFCGTCTKCIDACPTDAIDEDGYVLDGSKCISYLTIEYKDKLPESYADQMENWMFGCDICQEVCPWNRFSKPHNEPHFEPHPDLLSMEREEWMDITEDVFKEVFRKSAVKRTKFDGLKRNINFLKKSYDHE